jgi:sugar lactone lactonase YvrE
LDAAGNLFIADAKNRRIRMVPQADGFYFGQAMLANRLYTIATINDIEPTLDDDLLKEPMGVAIDRDGHVVIADAKNHAVVVIAKSSGRYYGMDMTRGATYTIVGSGQPGFAGDGETLSAAVLKMPNGVTADADGNLFICDTQNHRVRLIPHRDGRLFGRAVVANRIYTIAGNGTAGFGGDAGPATSAMLHQPSACVIDAQGHIWFSDTKNHRIRVVARQDGMIAGQPVAAGDIVTAVGNGVGALAGDAGPATLASCNSPTGLAFDQQSRLYIADSGNHCIRIVPHTDGPLFGHPLVGGSIYTVSGNGTAGFAGDAGPADLAQLKSPDGVAIDASGSLIVADTANNRIRLIAASPCGP